MVRPVRVVIVLVILCAGLPALAATNWTQPTPEELKMTSDPKAPGAPAEYLLLQNSTVSAYVDVYARIKIFTEEGKEKYADIRMDYLQGDESIQSVEGRTIHADGTVIPFTGQPYDKELSKIGGYTEMEKVFTLPDVEVGSILEFRYLIVHGADESPVWHVQQNLFVKKASFHFVPNGIYPVQTTWSLPPGTTITGNSAKGYDLQLENLPALPDEDYAPPMHALGYRVQFLYTNYKTAAEFWKSEGNSWSKRVNDVTSPNGKLKDAVERLIAPGDTDEQKLRKIYAAVMQLENTDFTRERTREENKAQKIKIKTANDIWTAQRGDSEDLTLLFVTMAKAAKMKAYVMYVTDRSGDIFMKDVPNWDQLDDMIAIVAVDGKETFFDPGERYCEYGKLKWTHTWTGGLRQVNGSESELATTPMPVYTDTAITRRAELQMDADGTIHGTMRVTMTGDAALHWRHEALSSDEEATKKKFDDSLQEDIAPGVRVKTSSFTGLADWTQPLLATVEVTGTMGTRTGHRIFVPGTFFEAQAKVPFASTTREAPVYMRYPYVVEDQFKLVLPANLTVESVPKDLQIPFLPNADFTSKFRSAPNAYAYGRRVRVANILYEVKDYPALRDFFQKMNTQDQTQVVLAAAPAVAAAGKAQ